MPCGWRASAAQRTSKPRSCNNGTRAPGGYVFVSGLRRCGQTEAGVKRQTARQATPGGLMGACQGAPQALQFGVAAGHRRGQPLQAAFDARGS